jgi:hypothetical protein
MNKSAAKTAVIHRTSNAAIVDNLCIGDLEMGLEAMNISSAGWPTVVLVEEAGVIRYHCAAEMSTDDLRALVTQAAAGLATKLDAEASA